MRSWAFLLGGLLIWTADFFLLYGIASIFLDTLLAHVLSGIVTVAAMAAAGWLLLVAWRRYRHSDDEFGRWIALIATLGYAISLLAVTWQGFPAILA